MVTAEKGGKRSTGTLGDVLYADKSQALVSENDWIGILKSIAAGDQRALHALYERTHLIVFTLAARITSTRAAAEELTSDVFHDAWRRASTYDAASGSVVAWMMNQVRSRALGRLRLEQRSRRVSHHRKNPPPAAVPELHEIFERPPASLQQRLAQRIAAETSTEPILLLPQRWVEPHWKEVAPRISCKLLATDTENHRVSMLVRLAPGTDYPPHRHAGLEELHLLHGELMIDGRKLYPGDYNRAEPGSVDSSVWSKTGCACVLVTSTRDELRPS